MQKDLTKVKLFQKVFGGTIFLKHPVLYTDQWWANPNHDWDLNRELNIFGDPIKYTDSIWNIEIRFGIWFKNFAVIFDQ